MRSETQFDAFIEFIAVGVILQAKEGGLALWDARERLIKAFDEEAAKQ